ncbi:cell wall-binding protein [uncultured Clostridium sp.]|uniref:cell wall-binding protein n=1 Tax=uncultured Clostridium sp. TaxID=59620 RepID=UPI0025F8177F|nr:cell wall-binding protein [uncultured Clostridium sp.]
MKKNFRNLALTLAAVNIAIPLTINSAHASSYSDGWHCNDGKWIYVKDGSVKTSWFEDKDGQWYYFNDDGIMQTGWINNDNKWYYLYENGAMAHSCYIGDYYLNNNGAWTSSIPKNNDNKTDINLEIKNLGYSSVQRIVDYNSADDKYSSYYRYVWYDGNPDNNEYASVNVFDNGSCSILLRKSGSMFNENLKKLFEYVVPGNGQKLLDEINIIKEDKIVEIGDKKINIKVFDDSIGIIIE